MVVFLLGITGPLGHVTPRTRNSGHSHTRRGKDRVPGWLGRIDSQLYFELLAAQRAAGISGATAEIGVHHGKSFIALCLALHADEQAYAIDVFENQGRNRDASGRGDRERLVANLAHHGVATEQVVIDARSSDEVVPADVLEAVGPVRFFSVDGGHWRAIVRNDLALATDTLCEEGIIALDDFMRAEWPDVTLGLFDWFEASDRELRPFAIGFNKLYLCRRASVTRYQAVLERSAFLRCFHSKNYEFLGENVPVFQTFALPEWSWPRRLEGLLRLYWPDLYAALRRGLRR